MNNIAIIGGGLSGMLLTINLLKQSDVEEQVSITLIDRNPEQEMGPAYSSNEEWLLLNVPACRMGAFSTEPDHFLKWAQKKGIAAKEWDFLPRKLYKDYIHEILQDILGKKKSSITLNRIQGEVTNIVMRDGKAEIFLDHGNFISDKVILALGNFPPRNLPIKNRSFIDSSRYFQDPWSDKFFASLRQNDQVFIIGTGQTMADVVIRLHARNHKGKIFAISRHGYLPLSHTSFEVYPSFYDEIKNLRYIEEILQTVRQHFVKAEKKGLDKNAVMDSLRPYTQEIWMNLSMEEKSRFLRHLFRYFEILRSRIPKETDALLNQMLQSGQLTLIKGRINDLVPEKELIEIHYLPHRETHEKKETAGLLINCTGPEVDYNKIEQPLIKNLLIRGLIQPDPLHLGMNALPNGAIVHSDGTAHHVLYTLGFPLRGILWEVLAAPEIRLQAEQLALLLLENQNS